MVFKTGRPVRIPALKGNVFLYMSGSLTKKSGTAEAILPSSLDFSGAKAFYIKNQTCEVFYNVDFG